MRAVHPLPGWPPNPADRIWCPTTGSRRVGLGSTFAYAQDRSQVDRGTRHRSCEVQNHASSRPPVLMGAAEERIRAVLMDRRNRPKLKAGSPQNRLAMWRSQWAPRRRDSNTPEIDSCDQGKNDCWGRSFSFRSESGKVWEAVIQLSGRLSGCHVLGDATRAATLMRRRVGARRLTPGPIARRRRSGCRGRR